MATRFLLRGHLATSFVTGVTLMLASPAHAEQANQPDDGPKQGQARAAELAQKLSNPIADLVSIPFQFNWRNGVGPDDELQMVLNIQPVVPIHLTDRWNVVGRFIVPVIAQPTLGAGVVPRTGLGDSLLSLFLSPATDDKLQWGVGPALVLPLTTDPVLGTGQWSAGPTAVGLYLSGGWTFVGSARSHSACGPVAASTWRRPRTGRSGR